MGVMDDRRAAKAAAQAKADAVHDRYVCRTYGLQPGDYARMLAEQDGRCAICMKVARAKRLSVDHDHNTGEVRGLLCQPCNRGLRSMEWDAHAAWNAVAYLTLIAQAYERTPNSGTA